MEKLYIDVDQKTGEGFFYGMHCEVTNRYYHSDLQQGFEKIIGHPAWTIMYDSAFKSGIMIFQDVSNVMKGKNDKELIDRLLWQFSACGFGVFEMTKLDKKGKNAIVTVRNCQNLSGYGKYPKPVCHPVRGLIGGAVATFLGEHCECTETKCAAVSGDVCVFEIKGTGKKLEALKREKPKSDMKNLTRKELPFDPEKGEVFFDGVNSSILTWGRTGIFQREFENTIGPTSRMIIYEECKKTAMKAVGTTTKTFLKLFGKLTMDMSIRKLTKQIPDRGWGVCEIVEIDKDRPSMIFRIRNCYNHVYYGPTKEPACYSMASIMAGGGEIVFGRPMVCTETKCEALGDPYCEFVTVPESEKK